MLSLATRAVPESSKSAVYFFNSRGERGGFDNRGSLFSPVSDKTSLIAPILESIVDVSIGMKMTFEFCVRVISRSDSMYLAVMRYCAVWSALPIIPAIWFIA